MVKYPFRGAVGKEFSGRSLIRRVVVVVAGYPAEL